MPARSRRQQRYLAAHFGGDWLKAHHFDVLAPGAPTDPKAHAIAAGKSRHAPHDRQHPDHRRA